MFALHEHKVTISKDKEGMKVLKALRNDIESRKLPYIEEERGVSITISWEDDIVFPPMYYPQVESITATVI